jgi:hypothetical protein
VLAPVPQANGDTYEQTLAFYRDLPYPRLEKLMDRYGSGVTSAWICKSRNDRQRADSQTLDEDTFNTVIEYNTDSLLVPTVNDIRKQYHRPDGKIVTRSARITALGQVIYENTRVNNLRDGLSRGWYLNGELAYTSNYREGELDGLGLFYAHDGQLLQIVRWNNGRCLDAWQLNQRNWQQTVHNGNGWITDYNWYFNDGGPCGSEHFADGINDRGTG